MKQNNINNLKDYLLNKSRWCTAAELASYLHTTPRTVQNYVREINNQNKDLIISSQEGYMYNPGKNAVSSSPDPFPEYDTPLKRMAFILKKLLYYGKTSYEELMEDLYVSESTLDSDMINIRNEVAPYNLRLRKRNNTFTLTGSESNLRQIIYHCIRLNSPAKALSRKVVQEDFPELNIGEICRQIDEIAVQNHLKIVEINYYYFISIICIQISRIKKGYIISSVLLEELMIKKFEEYHAAEQLAVVFQKEYGIFFPSDELYYLTVILISFCLPETPGPVNEIDIIPDIRSFTEKNLLAVTSRLHLDMSSPELIYTMEHTIQRMVIRKKHGILFPVPFSYSIRKNVPLLINYIIWMGEAISERYAVTINDDDIALLTFTITCIVPRREKAKKIKTLVILPDLSSFSKTFVNKVMEHYKNILDIENILTRIDGSETTAEDSLIISVFPLKKTNSTVVVSPFFTDDDQYLINNAIHRIMTDRNIDIILNIMKTELKPQHLKFNVPVTSRHRILNDISTTFYIENSISETAIHELLKRERISPTAFNELMAMPHITTRGTTHKNLYVIINSEPFSWGYSRINMLICAIWPREYLEEMQEFYQACAMIFSSPLVIKKLLTAVDLTSLVSLLESLKHY